MALFRVVQEALNNVAKHSQASRVEIRNALKGNRLSLVVHDNGKGFPEAEAAAMPDTLKLGLISMGERLDAIGGTLAVTSASGAGTTITVEIGL
jgi:signal transduction histidine kinase